MQSRCPASEAPSAPGEGGQRAPGEKSAIAGPGGVASSRRAEAQQAGPAEVEARRAGEDVVDLGFGNPDLPSPDVAVEKLREAVLNPRNHRYSASRGIPNLRRAVCDLYRRRFGVELDPDTEVIPTYGSKEAIFHLAQVVLDRDGDKTLVLSTEPGYPVTEPQIVLSAGLGNSWYVMPSNCW